LIGHKKGSAVGPVELQMKKKLLVKLDCCPDALGAHASLVEPPKCASQAEQITRVLEHLYLGSWKDANDATLLQTMGITHVLNTAKEVKEIPEPIEKLRLIYKTVPISDSIEAADVLSHHFDDAFGFIDEALQGGGRALIHCRRGISRSPAVVIAYLMEKFQRPFEHCFDVVKSKRNIALNLGFQSLLQDYQPPYSRSRAIIAEELGGRQSSSSSIGVGSCDSRSSTLSSTLRKEADTITTTMRGTVTAPN
jgi:protein-tyrosine phosphatase